MKNFTALSKIDDDSYFIFKHSSTCPISSAAHGVIGRVKDGLPLPVYLLVIQHDRAASKNIADHFGIRHESPQLILVKNDEAIWEASHGSISPASIKLALEKL